MNDERLLAAGANGNDTRVCGCWTSTTIPRLVSVRARVRRASAMATTAPTAAPSPVGGNVRPPSDDPTPEEARSTAEAAAELQKAHVALLTKEVERVGKKQRVARDKAVEVVDALLAEVRAARERLERTTDAGERSAAMNELRASLMEKDYPEQVRDLSGRPPFNIVLTPVEGPP